MRISDWSSDVCSSDLTGESQGIDLELSTTGAIGANEERTIDFSQIGVSITLNSAFADTDITATNTMASVVNANADTTLNFKIGAGTTANDTVAITIGSTTVNALGLPGSNITHAAHADQAPAPISSEKRTAGKEGVSTGVSRGERD